MSNDDDDAEVGTCDLCGQEMIRTADDCWHPWTVTRSCPPERVVNGIARVDFGRFGRPGREHFVLDALGGER